MAELIQFKVPKGWVIIDNKLYDTDPIIDTSDGRIINWYEGFIEDVLWILEFSMNKNGEYEFPNANHYTIDLSWRPDGDADGQYYAKLSWCTVEEMLDVDQYESKNRFEIKDKIEFWMNDITDNYSEHHSRMKK